LLAIFIVSIEVELSQSLAEDLVEEPLQLLRSADVLLVVTSLHALAHLLQVFEASTSQLLAQVHDQRHFGRHLAGPGHG
jgi:hypothetical protein